MGWDERLFGALHRHLRRLFRSGTPAAKPGAVSMEALAPRLETLASLLVGERVNLRLPYILNENIQYAPNKYFKKEGTIFIGGNLLLKDSRIENNGKISVGGEVILIGESQITGTGTII